jgi:general secretion pathway protein K
MKRRQRGVAVVTALLLTTLAITIVASLFWQQQVQVRSIENQRLQLQKQWILRGALDWASLILRADGMNSAVDHLGEPWAVPLAETRLDQYVENGRTDADASDATVSGNIIDAMSRYNVTNLATNGKINKSELEDFQSLLSILRLNPSLAQATADTIAAGQASPVPTGPSAQQTSRPMRVEYVDDLLAVPGMTPDILEKLKKYIVVLPDGGDMPITPININTAPAEVLAAKLRLSLADAATLAASRDNAYLNMPMEAVNRLPGKEISGLDKAATGSRYFLVNGKVRLNRAGLEMQALIRRDGGTTRLIWIREY